MFKKKLLHISALSLSAFTATVSSEEIKNIKTYGSFSSFDIYDGVNGRFISHSISLESFIFSCTPSLDNKNYTLTVRVNEVLGDKAKISFRIDNGELYQLSVVPYGKFSNQLSHDFHEWSYNPEKILNEIKVGNKLSYKVVGNFNSSPQEEITLKNSFQTIDDFYSRCNQSFLLIVNEVNKKKENLNTEVKAREEIANSIIKKELIELGVIYDSKDLPPIRYLRELYKSHTISKEDFERIKRDFYNIKNR